MRALRILALAAIAIGSALAASAPAVPAAAPLDLWPGLADTLFPNRTMAQDGMIIKLGTPLSAEDAALVPITLHMESAKKASPADDAQRITKVTLVIDNNPAPVAAVIEFGPKAGVTTFETRVRVNQNTKIHAVAETADGKLYVSESYVAAAGGCSAPSATNLDPNDPEIGTIKVRQLAPQYVSDNPQRKEAVVMIKHPNNSGMQLDQTTHLYIPARYVDSLKVTQGDDLLFALTGGISISEDPNFRFDYLSNGANVMRVDASDTTGKKFSKDWPLNPAI
ncbi:MAG TPA: quinoprotein dehydrogenase-associated SoxYZ-like carrier [Methylovirgula sp.]|nr:quinoprotein dehydrogenase-associated SoxYZ-like carrier [Methylovirgula sp.]